MCDSGVGVSLGTYPGAWLRKVGLGGQPRVRQSARPHMYLGRLHRSDVPRGPGLWRTPPRPPGRNPGASSPTTCLPVPILHFLPGPTSCQVYLLRFTPCTHWFPSPSSTLPGYSSDSPAASLTLSQEPPFLPATPGSPQPHPHSLQLLLSPGGSFQAPGVPLHRVAVI